MPGQNPAPEGSAPESSKPGSSAPGSEREPPADRAAAAAHPAGGSAGHPGNPPPPPPAPPGPRRGRLRSPSGRRRRLLWPALSFGALLVAVIVIIAVVAVRGSGSGVPQGTPDGAQLGQILPGSQALPAGWYLVFAHDSGTSYAQPGNLPPRPLAACYDFNLGFDLGVPGDTFVSSASETANFGTGPGDGFLRIDLFGVVPGDAAAAIRAVSGWARRCSSYTDRSAAYTVTAAAVPGLGDQSLAVGVTQRNGVGTLRTDNNTLLVRVGNDIIVIECLAPPRALISSLASLAAPMARRLPAASALPASGPATRRPSPAPSPNLSASQLERLLPVSRGLPAQYYEGQPLTPDDNTSPGGYPLSAPPQALACDQIPKLEGQGLTQFDRNFRNVAYLDAYSPQSNAMDVVIDEPSTVALAEADVAALSRAASRCPALSANAGGQVTRFRTTVTAVPGLGNQNVLVVMTPLTTTANGPQGILLARAGDGLVMVDYDLSVTGQALPSVVSIARPILAKL